MLKRIASYLRRTPHHRWAVSALIVMVPIMLVIAAAIVGVVQIMDQGLETDDPVIILIALLGAGVTTLAIRVVFNAFTEVCIKYDHLKTEAQSAASTGSQASMRAQKQKGDNQMTTQTNDPEELCQCDNCVLARGEAQKIVDHISAFSKTLGDNEHKDAIMERVLVETAHYALQHYVGLTIYNAYKSDTDPHEAADEIQEMLSLIINESHKDGVEHAKDALIADKQAAENDPATHAAPTRRDQ